MEREYKADTKGKSYASTREGFHEMIDDLSDNAMTRTILITGTLIPESHQIEIGILSNADITDEHEIMRIVMHMGRYV